MVRRSAHDILLPLRHRY